MSKIYIPVLKNRDVEMHALRNLYVYPLSKKIVPLIEVVQEKFGSNRTLYDSLRSVLDVNTPIMVDILNLKNPPKCKKVISDFLNNINHNPIYRSVLFKSLSQFKNLIPVISYDENSYNFAEKTVQNDSKQLRKIYKRIGYRLKIDHFENALKEILSVINGNDVIIFDIGHTRYDSINLIDYYYKLNHLKAKYKIKLFVINSVIPNDLTNKGLINNTPIPNMDNGLRDVYTSYGFDGFGDYAAIKSHMPTDGGTISPGFIFYSYKYNKFIGYRYNSNRALSEFRTTIIPSLVNSIYWKEYNSIHQHYCPGCRSIIKLNQSNSTGNQATCKRFSIEHYIYSMYELL
jgi:hypothetical protein